MTSPPDWAVAVPSTPDVHRIPAAAYQPIPLPGDVQEALWHNLLESIWQQFVLLVNGVLSALNAGPQITDWANGILDGIADALGVGQNAQDTANYAAAQVAAIWAAIRSGGGFGGTYFVDEFDYPEAAELPDPPFSVYYTGPGAGSLGTTGDGRARWSAAGAYSRTALVALPTLNTDTQSITVVLPDPPTFSGYLETAIVLVLRSNDTGTDWVECKLVRQYDGALTAVLGYRSGGDYTELDTVTGLACARGDLWEFRAGTGSDEREFVLLRNGVTRMSYTDSDDVTAMDSDHRYPGLVMIAGVTVILLISYVQIAPPDIDVVAAYDRNT